MEPRGFIRLWRASLWHHLVSPIRFAKAGLSGTTSRPPRLSESDPPASPEGEADGGQVAGKPDRNPDHKRPGLKPRLSAVGVKPFIYCLKER